MHRLTQYSFLEAVISKFLIYSLYGYNGKFIRDENAINTLNTLFIIFCLFWRNNLNKKYSHLYCIMFAIAFVISWTFLFILLCSELFILPWLSRNNLMVKFETKYAFPFCTLIIKIVFSC